MKKDKTQIFLKIIIAGFIIFFLDKEGLLNLQSVYSSLKSANTLIILFLIFIVVTLGAFRWFIILNSQGFKENFLNCFSLYYTGYCFNYILPGGISGDVIKINNISRKRNEKKIAAGLSVIVDRVLGLIAMLTVFLFFLPHILFKLNPAKWNFINENNFMLLYTAILTFILAFCLLIFLIVLGNKKNYKIIFSFLIKKKNKIFKIGKVLISAIFAYRKIKKTVAINITIAALAQFIIAFCLMLIATNLFPSTDISLIDFNLSSILAQIVAIIPISPGGIGINEAAFSKMIYYLNNRILLDYASIYLTFRVINIIFSFPGIVFFIIKPKSLK